MHLRFRKSIGNGDNLHSVKRAGFPIKITVHLWKYRHEKGHVFIYTWATYTLNVFI